MTVAEVTVAMVNDTRSERCVDDKSVQLVVLKTTRHEGPWCRQVVKSRDWEFNPQNQDVSFYSQDRGETEAFKVQDRVNSRCFISEIETFSWCPKFRA